MLKKHEVGTRGVVISRASSGEGSVMVSIFTEELGLVSAIAKSAREERSKLRPHLQVGTFGFFDLVEGVAVWRVIGAVKTKNYYFAFRNTPKAQEAAARLLSLLRQLIHGEERDSELFEIVWNFLVALESIPDDMLVFAERFAVLQTLAALGYVSKETVPHAERYDYSEEALRTLLPQEKQMIVDIKNGFVASGLV